MSAAFVVPQTTGTATTKRHKVTTPRKTEMVGKTSKVASSVSLGMESTVAIATTVNSFTHAPTVVVTPTLPRNMGIDYPIMTRLKPATWQEVLGKAGLLIEYEDILMGLE
ncbi:hypothetical protein GYMLUDRAFT_57586 [Collybiopsis luxurians FD-317 M1]|uniref:Uncharacterized protein n=1 Tax=Collybiopsis luxurians FD-317 M1 TaxID=944289 RepID=A0A0D0CUU7_9AGAR|nr:hypothetical protein GYMLUDRAFT_57586 [Collybiopsis luxurians FD-317 M1]